MSINSVGAEPGPPRVTDALRSFIIAPDDERRFQALENEQDSLLSDETDQTLGWLAARALKAGEDHLAGEFAAFRSLLFEARVLGVSAAWAKRQGSRARAAESARIEQERRQEEAREAEEAAREERGEAQAERDALWAEYGVTNVKNIYDTGPRESGLSWRVVGSVPSRTIELPLRPAALESWLLLTSFRDQRRFLEGHLELLGQESTSHLNDLRATLRSQPDFSPSAEALRDLQIHAEVLEDARTRGGTAQAVREAYVDAHGGFTTPIPYWLIGVLASLERLRVAAKAGDETPTARSALLRAAVGRAERDGGLTAETLAELRNELGRALARGSRDSHDLATARSLHRQALQDFDQHRYPRQWIRTNLLIAAAEEEPAELEPSELERWRAQRADELVTSGNAHLAADELAPAAGRFEQATILAPGHAEAWLGLTSAYTRLKFFSAALAAGEHAVRLARHEASAWTMLGSLHRSHGQSDQAVLAFQQATTLSDEDSDLWFQLAGALSDLDRQAEALNAYERSLSIDPGFVFAWHNVGTLLQQMNRLGEALSAFDRAVALVPALFPSWASKGNVLLRLGRYDEALTAFNVSLSHSYEFHQSWLGRGTALLYLERYAEALSALEGALTLSPNDSDTWNNLALALAGVGRDSESAYAKDRAGSLRGSSRPTPEP